MVRRPWDCIKIIVLEESKPEVVVLMLKVMGHQQKERRVLEQKKGSVAVCAEALGRSPQLSAQIPATECAGQFESVRISEALIKKITLEIYVFDLFTFVMNKCGYVMLNNGLMI